MLLLAIERGWTTYQIASVVHRSSDMVLLSTAWKRELPRVIGDDPRQHGVDHANWTTILLPNSGRLG